MATPRMVELASGLSLSCAEQGPTSGMPVVLLHGPTDSWRSYEPVMRHAPPWLRLIAVSQRGHGDSDRPAGPYDVATLAVDALDLMDVLDLERGVLVGHSGSCLVARRVAIDHPERVAGLFLEASPFNLAADPDLLGFVDAVVDDLEDPIDSTFVRSFVADTSAPGLDPGLLDMLVGEVHKVPARVWRAVFDGLVTYDDRTELGSVEAPTALVWGDEDGLVSREAQESLVTAIPRARLLVYADVGHTPRWDAPVRFARDLTAFVESVG